MVPPFWKRGWRGDLLVLLGNRRLIQREGIDPSRAEAALTRLESEGKTAMLVGADGALWV